jgi:hypothetical protein
VVGLEADFRRRQGVDEPVMFLAGNVGPEPALDGAEEARQLGSVFVALPRAFDRGGELVQESSQVVFHARTLSLLTASGQAGQSVRRQTASCTSPGVCEGSSGMSWMMLQVVA